MRALLLLPFLATPLQAGAFADCLAEPAFDTVARLEAVRLSDGLDNSRCGTTCLLAGLEMATTRCLVDRVDDDAFTDSDWNSPLLPDMQAAIAAVRTDVPPLPTWHDDHATATLAKARERLLKVLSPDRDDRSFTRWLLRVFGDHAARRLLDDAANPDWPELQEILER